MATFAGAYPWRSRGSKSASSDGVDDAAAPTAETVDPRRRGPPSRRDRANRETGGHPAARCLPSAQVVRPPPCTARSLLVAATAPEGTDFWTAYYGGGSCEGLTVLDPFM